MRRNFYAGHSRTTEWRRTTAVNDSQLQNAAPLQGASYHGSNAEQLDVDPDAGPGFPDDHDVDDVDMEAPRSDNDVDPSLDFSYIASDAAKNTPRFADPRGMFYSYNDESDADEHDGRAKKAVVDIIGQASASKYADSEDEPVVQQQLKSEYFRNMTLVKLLSRIRFKDNVSDKLFALILFIGQFFWVLGYLKCLFNLSSGASLPTKKKMSGKEIQVELGIPPCFRSTHIFENVSHMSPNIEQAGNRPQKIGTRQMVKCPTCCRLPIFLDENLQPNQICGLKTRTNSKACSGVLSYADGHGKAIPYYVSEQISLLDQLDVVYGQEHIWNILDLNREVRDKHNITTSNPDLEKFRGLHPFLTQGFDALNKAVQIPDADGNLHDLYDEIHGKYNAMLVLSIDGANMKQNDAFKNKMVPASLGFLDVNGAERFSEEFLMLVGVVNGSEKGETYNENLGLMTRELLYLLSGQYKKTDPRPGGIEHTIRPILTLIIMDSPARNKGCGTTGWMNECGCKNCTHKMQTEIVMQDDGTERTIHSWYTPPLVAENISDYARDEAVTRAQADAYKREEKVGPAKILAQESGIRWSVLQDVPYFSIIKMAPGEPMHLGEGEIPKLYDR